MENNDKEDNQYYQNKALLESLSTMKSKEYIIKTKNLFEKFQNGKITAIEYSIESEILRTEYRNTKSKTDYV